MGKIAIDTAAREAPQFLKSMLKEQAAKQTAEKGKPAKEQTQKSPVEKSAGT